MSDRIYYSNDAKMMVRREKMAMTSVATILGVAVGLLLAWFWGETLLEKGGQLTNTMGTLIEQGNEMAQKVGRDVSAASSDAMKQVNETIEKATA